MNPAKRVIVVGAGAAGLAAAYTLRNRGFEVTLVEAADHPGGRMAGEKINGFHLSTGAKYLHDHYRVAIEMCQALGVPLQPVSTAEVTTAFYRRGKLHLADAANLLTGRLFSAKALWQLSRFSRHIRRRRADFESGDITRLLDLDTSATCADYVRELGCGDALKESLSRVLRAVLLSGTERPGTVAGLEILWGPAKSRFSKFRSPAQGVGAFSDALADACADDTLLSTPVERIVLKGTRKRAAGVFARGAFLRADAVICATTATGALKILPDLPDDLGSVLRKVTYSSCCHVAFGVEGHPLEMKPGKRHAGSFFPKLPDGFLVAHADGTALSPATAPPGKSIVHVFATEERTDELFALDDEEITSRSLAEIRRFVPSMPTKPLFARVYRFEEAVCLGKGGTLTALHEIRRQGYPGVEGLFLAGDYMNLPTVNGALRSGKDAAEDVIGFLSGGRRSPEV